MDDHSVANITIQSAYIRILAYEQRFKELNRIVTYSIFILFLNRMQAFLFFYHQFQYFVLNGFHLDFLKDHQKNSYIVQKYYSSLLPILVEQ